MKNKTSRISPLLFLLICLASTAFANEVDDLSFFNEEIPVVLSATRLAQPQTEAPATITLIDRQMIKLSGAKEIPELFRLVPGMHVNYFRGNSATVGYQGLNSEFPQGVQVLVDGRSLYNPLFGGVNWRTFPINIEEIERIEVIRGANSTSFGSNAFQSVINISTTHASQFNGQQAKQTIGERGYKRSYVKTGHSFADIDFRLSASHTDNNGYANNKDDSRQDSFNTRIDYQVTPHDSVQINASAVNTLLQTENPDPGDEFGLSYDPTDPPRSVDESSFSLHTKWEHITNNEHVFITQFSYAQFKSKDKSSSSYIDNVNFPPHSVPVTTSSDYTLAYDRWDFEFEHQLKPSSSTRLIWGAGLRSDRVYMPFWTGTTKKHDNSLQRLFSNLEWRPVDNIILNIGGLWEHSQLVGDDFAPRVAINYLLTPKQSLRFSTSRAFRAPVIVENNFNAELVFQANPGGTINVPIFEATPGLNPETVRSFELGYHGLFAANALTLDIKFFRNEYDHIIDTADCSPCATGASNTLLNQHQVQINGYEFELNYKPSPHNLLHIGYAYNHANVGQKTGNDIENIYNSIPKDVFNILAAHTFQNELWASIAYYHTGSIENLDSGSALGPMRRLDLNAGRGFKVAEGHNIDVSFTLQLALDKNKDFLDEFNLDNRAFIEVSYTVE